MSMFDSGGVGSTNFKVAYTADALRNDIDRLQRAWRAYQKSRERVAIYRFLGAILDMVTIWNADAKVASRSRQALAITGCKPQETVEPYRVLLTVAAHPREIDDRTLSKWVRVLQFAADKKLPSTPLRKFIKRYGGINDCAAEFTRRLKNRMNKGRDAIRPRG